MHSLEKRREMNGTFPGRIVLVEGDEVDVDLQISADKVRLATPFAEIGLWDRGSIHFERNSIGGYELSVADDVVTFYPADLGAFSVAVGDSDGVPEPGDSDGPSLAPEPSMPLVAESFDDSLIVPDEGPIANESPTPELGSTPDDVRVDQGVRVDQDVGVDQNESGTDEPSVSKFGPSSRERLAAAMSGFRERQDAEEAVEETAEERTSSPGFVIPGDAGYAFPGEEGNSSIQFDEDVEDSSVADDIMATQRKLRGASTMSFNPDKLKKIALGLVGLAVLAGLGFAVPVVLGFFSGNGDAPPATVVATTVPATEATPTTIAPTTDPTVGDDPSVPVDQSAFQLSPEGFVQRWNDTAAQVSPGLRLRSSLPAGDFEVGFTEYIAMIGTSGPTPSGLSAFTLEIDPTGPSSSDRLGIQSLGLAIAVADPTLEPRERAAVLGAMDLDVRNPDLEGLDGSFSRGGIDYRLVFDAEDLMLRLTISPS